MTHNITVYFDVKTHWCSDRLGAIFPRFTAKYSVASWPHKASFMKKIRYDARKITFVR